MSLLRTFDVNDLVYDEISSLFSNLKQSKLFAPLLPNIVDHFIDEISTNYDLSEVNDYINLNYLPGLIDYDIKMIQYILKDKLKVLLKSLIYLVVVVLNLVIIVCPNLRNN